MNKYKEYKMCIERKAKNENIEINNHTETITNKEVNIRSIIEGIIYVVGDEGITLEQLEIVLEIDKKIIIDHMDALIKKYDNNEYTFEISNYGDVYKFITKPDLHPYLEKLFTNTKVASLSQSALETLAIIAYKQPIEKSEIEEIRGVGADHMIRKLLARELIRECGRSNAPGKPYLYEVTKIFMDNFKLLSLDELPELPDYISSQQENLFDSDK